MEQREPVARRAETSFLDTRLETPLTMIKFNSFRTLLTSVLFPMCEEKFSLPRCTFHFFFSSAGCFIFYNYRLVVLTFVCIILLYIVHRSILEIFNNAVKFHLKKDWYWIPGTLFDRIHFFLSNTFSIFSFPILRKKNSLWSFNKIFLFQFQ